MKQYPVGKQLILLIAAMVGMTSVANATPIVVPAGLNPGDQYRLVFVTSGSRDATSTDIADYNTFVTDQANLSPELLALSTTWMVIGSTESVSAFDNIGGTFSIPIFNLGGQLVANGSADLWDGSIYYAIEFDQYGDQFTAGVYTGSNTAGAALHLNSDCCTLGAGVSTEFGNTTSTGSGWVSSSDLINAEGAYFYGISDVLTVQAVPEPGTITLVGLGGVLLLFGLRRRRHAGNRS